MEFLGPVLTREAGDETLDEGAEEGLDLPDGGHELLVRLGLEVEPRPVDVVRQGARQPTRVLVGHARRSRESALKYCGVVSFKDLLCNIRSFSVKRHDRLRKKPILILGVKN